MYRPTKYTNVSTHLSIGSIVISFDLFWQLNNFLEDKDGVKGLLDDGQTIFLLFVVVLLGVSRAPLLYHTGGESLD